MNEYSQNFLPCVHISILQDICGGILTSLTNLTFYSKNDNINVNLEQYDNNRPKIDALPKTVGQLIIEARVLRQADLMSTGSIDG